MALSRYEIEKTISIFKNDLEFQTVVVKNAGIDLGDEDYRILAETMLEEKSHLSSYNIEELNSETPPFLRNQIAAIFGLTSISRDVYYQTIYTFKYSTIKTFFRSNMDRFLPDYDYLNISSNEKMKIFQEAFLREYDRFSAIIDEMYNLPDVDKAPDKYLNYLAQAIGYEREDSKLLADSSFRELIKNIIEIYKIKGTNYSFELFFNFLGFEATISEYWFDKRYSDPNISGNPYTGVSSNDTYNYYITPIKPTEYIPEGMLYPYVVTENKIVGTLDCNEFTRLAQAGDYTVAQLLGDVPGYPGTPFTFFKTNIMEYSLASIKTTQTQEEELSAEDLATIKRYADFLTPIFIAKNIVVKIIPYEESALSILPSDLNRPDPRSKNPNNNDDNPLTNVDDESMFHQYQGRQPSHYYWNDGTRFYDDPIPNTSVVNWAYPDIEPGGHFISGFDKDTHEKIYDRAPGSNSVYDQLRLANPDWTSEEILTYISNLIHIQQLFQKWNFNTQTNMYYDVRDRDLIPPFIDERFYLPAISFSNLDSFEIGTPISLTVSDINDAFTYLFGDIHRVSDAQNAIHFTDNYNTSVINKITADNGSSHAEIEIIDNERRFQFFENLTKESQVSDLIGDFTDGSEWVTNIDYNNIIAPAWSPAVYTEGDLVKDSGNTFICIQGYDGTGDSVLNPQYWQLTNAINLIKVGMKIYRPNNIFDLEVLQVDIQGNRFRLEKVVNFSSSQEDLILFNKPIVFIETKATGDFRNSGTFKVIDANSVTVLNGSTYETKTILTLDIPLYKNQLYSMGFVQIYAEPQRMKNFRFPFLFNVLKMQSNP